MRARRSRYAYWWQYCLALILAVLWMYAHDRGFDAISSISGIIALALVVLLEFIIRQKSVIIVKGGLDVHLHPSKFIPFQEITVVHVHQLGISKWFRFGTLEIVTRQGALSIGFVHEPSLIAREVRKYVRA